MRSREASSSSGRLRIKRLQTMLFEFETISLEVGTLIGPPKPLRAMHPCTRSGVVVQQNWKTGHTQGMMKPL